MGLGEYDYPDGAVGDLRQLFLLTIRRDVPQALEALESVDSDSAFAAWAAAFHVVDPWLLDVAQRTRNEWRDDPGLRKHRVWADVIRSGAFVPEPPAIRWCPTVETEEAFLARVNDYIRDVRRWAVEQGLELTLQKRNLRRDLAALAQYQIKGDDLDAVADEYFGGAENEDTARKAITSIANLLAITLRK